MTDNKQEALRNLALGMLAHIQTMNDQELAHVHADNVLTNLLRGLGFDDVVEEYNKVEKWYA